MNEHIPTRIELHVQSKELELTYADSSYRLPAELLRVMSPSAEVRGHGKGQEVLQTGKRSVALTGVQPTGHYAVKLVFNDGHDTGIYTWEYLQDLCVNQDCHWQRYLAQLKREGGSRDVCTTETFPPAPKGCATKH